MLNIALVIDCRVITTYKQQKVDINNVCKNTRKVNHDYAVGDLVYMDMTDIYRKLYYKNIFHIE